VSETFTVGELCRAVQSTIEDTFADEVWVTGAISGLSRSANGHVYFDLVDPNDDLGAATEHVVPVALFASSRHRVNAILRRTGKIRMRDGVEIRIRGKVAYYPPQGRIQLVMSLIDPAYTVGQMAMARQLLLDKLSAEGLLDANRALPLPAPPLRIALVTSYGSAAHADFVHELDVSGHPFAIELFDCRVQGIDAVPSLVEGIHRAGRADVDVVVVIRGGGAKTDLAAFDHERVARAIARCPRPVVVGVGHEVDRSVADEVANTSAKTPTAAAALLVEAVEGFAADLDQAASRLITLATNRLDLAARRLAASGNQLLVAAETATAVQAARLDAAAAGLHHRGERALDRAGAAVEQAAVRLRALDPAEVLARGWTITHTADGELIRDAAGAPVGTSVVTTTASGSFASTVTDHLVELAEDDRPGDDGGNSGRSGDTVRND